MRKALLMVPVLAVLFGLVGTQSASAQMWPGSSCGGGVIELVNSNPCDYNVTIVYWYLGSFNSLSLTVPAGGTATACYDHTTTAVMMAEVTNLSTFGTASLSNPGYPGVTGAGIMGGGCTGVAQVLWENWTSTGPGHVTNLILY